MPANVPDKPCDILITNPAQLITMLPDLSIHGRSVIDAGSGPINNPVRRHDSMQDIGLFPANSSVIGITDGTITLIADTDYIDMDAITGPGTTIIDASKKVVMPGFVDPHTHLIFAGSREGELTLKLKGLSYLEILARGGGILHTVALTRNASLETLIDEGRRRLDVMLAHGTLTAQAKSGYGLDHDTELRSLQAIQELHKTHPVDLVPSFLGAHAIPPEFEHDPTSYIEHIIDTMLPEIVQRDLARYCDIFVEQGVFSIDEGRRLLTAARDLGFDIEIHADEIVHLGGAALAAELEARSATHLMHSNDEDLKAMAEKGVIGILVPGTPYSLMEKSYPDARHMIDLGVPIALSTDLNPNCWTESMQFIISLACYNMKMLPSEAIVAATINAAYAIGKESQCGDLAPLKPADIIILDIPSYEFIPYRFGVNMVETVIKNGTILIDHFNRIDSGASDNGVK